MRIQRILGVGACALLTLSLLTGCGGAGTSSDLSEDASSVAVTDDENGILAHSVTKRHTSATAGGSATTAASVHPSVTDNDTTAQRTSATQSRAESNNSEGTRGSSKRTSATSNATSAVQSTRGNTQSSATQSTPTAAKSSATAAKDEYIDGLKVVARIGGAPLCRFDDNLYKLDVPFENIYTAVFFLRLTGNEWAIVDTATDGTDVNNYILPAAANLGISTAQIKAILLTHEHGDHAGGLRTLLSKCSSATVYGVKATNSDAGTHYRSIADGASLFGGVVKMVTLPGHAAEACGYYDTRSKTVMTGDSIQFYGAGQYGCQVYGGLSNYEASMEKLKGMVADGAIENIIISHRYAPVSAISKGRANSLQYMTTAQECYGDIKAYTIEQFNNGTRSADMIMRNFIAERSRQYENFPTGSFSNVMGTIINTYCR